MRALLIICLTSSVVDGPQNLSLDCLRAGNRAENLAPVTKHPWKTSEFFPAIFEPPKSRAREIRTGRNPGGILETSQWNLLGLTRGSPASACKEPDPLEPGVS